MILDTNALSFAADSDKTVFENLIKGRRLALPVVVIGEYRYGIGRSNRREMYEGWLEAMLQDCTILDITTSTAHRYAEIRSELRQAGRPIPTNDLWIAALCREHRLPLLSQDRHFDSVAGIQRVSW